MMIGTVSRATRTGWPQPRSSTNQADRSVVSLADRGRKLSASRYHSFGDEAAIAFAAAFYRALGFGCDVQTAYRLGKNELQLKSIPEEQTPELFWCHESVDPAKVVLVVAR
jgi:hypothetical protein